ncbi:MAG: Fis family transcriptional regulator [Deltaproteobacteria bacterium HGW-Deltaproteobacteria-15]|jgi:DNA-binding NtrC family response regulator|nr:MAG: Fis family transcriptional regulator [Deltaproteobacteria bacterium HGW-Deltaproteobacteria-15]
MAVKQPRIMVVDDEIGICQSCIRILGKEGHRVEYAVNGYDALKMMNENGFDVIITDLKMSSMGGMEVLRRVKESYPDSLVIVITGYASVSSAVEVMRMGAYDYLPKPFTPEELRSVVRRAVSDWEIALRNRELMGRKFSTRPPAHQLIGESPKLQAVISMIGKVAPTDSTVLICGESGTGKELIARAIHANSRRKNRVFFAVDCGTLSGNLLESELFGYVKGAFTGAFRNKEGIFKVADQGTVFLDEISNISPEVQSRLLRFLETQEYLPIGSTTKQKVDVRLIFATNRDLMAMVKEGSFREDFYYRIFVYPIFTPPLRERKLDVLPIAYHFLRQCRDRTGKDIRGFDKESLNRLTAYDWPGNVRQLKNAIERAVILCEREEITARELSLSEDTGSSTPCIPETNEELKRLRREIRETSIRDLERNFILQALMQNDWNVTRAARKVGLQRPNFQNLMKKHGVSLHSRTASREPSQ